jgi:tripartite-type tricarboxylate transporter receptor subunit TctC
MAGLAALPVKASIAQTQEPYPTRPIRLVVPYGPGAATELFARQVAASVQAHIGQPLVVENRAGANAVIGTDYVARSAPDGYTLLFANDQIICVNPFLLPRLSYDPTRDFVPVAGLATVSYLLVVSPKLPVASVAELVALAKSRPGQLTFASTGVGTGSHLIGETFQREAGIELTFVPYPAGVSQLLADLMTGTISLMFYSFQPLKPLLEEGHVRALATAGSERPEWMPGLPTLRELGYPRSTSAAWFGVYAPAATPQDRIVRLADAFRKAMDNPGLRTAMRASGTDARFRSSAELAAFNASEQDRCREQVAISGARVN